MAGDCLRRPDGYYYTIPPEMQDTKRVSRVSAISADIVVMDGKFWANFYHVNPRKNLPVPPKNGKPPRET